MSKDYDRIDWPFVAAVLQRFGFSSHFIKLLASCLTSVSFSFNLNRYPEGLIVPSRGLRQGDPMSPYLFDLCAEALSSSIKRSVLGCQLLGIKVTRTSL